MKLLNLFSKKENQAKQAEDEYNKNLGDVKVLRKLIEFLPPEECAKVFQMGMTAKKRNMFLARCDKVETPKGEFLKAALICADWKKTPFGYDNDKTMNDILEPLNDMAKAIGETLPTAASENRATFVDKMQKTIVPYLLLDAMRKHPEKSVDILATVRQKGKAFLPKTGERVA